MLNRLRNPVLKIKPSKCQFILKETKYLGFVINKKEIKPENKTKVIQSIPEPNTVR